MLNLSKSKSMNNFPMSSHESSPPEAQRYVPLSVERTTADGVDVVTVITSILQIVLSIMLERSRIMSRRQNSKSRRRSTVCYPDWNLSKISNGMKRAATTQFC